MTSRRRRGRPPHDDVLTPAEWRVAEAVRHGIRNREIGQRLGVSTDAVKYHVANALEKLGLSCRAELRCWTGLRRDSNLFSKEPTMVERLKLGPIQQISRTVRDIKAARHWYEEVLGLDHLYTFGNLAFFDCGGVRLFLSEGEAAEAESIIYFRVHDIRTAYQALASRGVQFTEAPHMIHRHQNGTEEWLAAFRDNEDRSLAIMAQVEP